MKPLIDPVDPATLPRTPPGDQTSSSQMKTRLSFFFLRWLIKLPKAKEKKKALISETLWPFSFSATIRPAFQILNDLISIAPRSITHNTRRVTPEWNLSMSVTLRPFTVRERWLQLFTCSIIRPRQRWTWYNQQEQCGVSVGDIVRLSPYFACYSLFFMIRLDVVTPTL